MNMKMNIRRTSFLLFLGALCSPPSWALIQPDVEDREKFCSQREEKYFVPRRLTSKGSRMPFTSEGGVFGIGLCWWHSRLQRNSAYLAHFRLDLPAPSRQEARRIVAALRRGRQVVVIPGHLNFYSFARAHWDIIRAQMEAWQIVDGFILQRWVQGLRGKPEVAAEEMALLMDELYERVSEGDVVYQKLQIKGLRSHSWLVVGMKETETGHELKVVDSLLPSTPLVRYFYNREKGTLTKPGSSKKFVPYTEFDGELRKLKKTIGDFCSSP